MQQKNSAENFFSDMQSTFKQMLGNAPTAYPFDFKTMMEAQRKNIQALTEANKCAMQGWQALAQRQTEMVSQFVQENSGIARETFADGTPQDKIAKGTEMMKSSIEKSIQNSQELVELCRKCVGDAAEIINQRTMATMNEMKASAKK